MLLSELANKWEKSRGSTKPRVYSAPARRQRITLRMFSRRIAGRYTPDQQVMLVEMVRLARKLGQAHASPQMIRAEIEGIR